MLSPTAVEAIRSTRKLKILKGVVFLVMFMGFGVMNYLQRGWELPNFLFFVIMPIGVFVVLFLTRNVDQKLIDFLQNEPRLLQKIYSKRDDGKIEIKFYSSDNRVYELEIGKKEAEVILQELKMGFPHVEFVLDHEKTFIR